MTDASNSAASSSRTVRLKVRRQAGPDSPPYWEEFEVPREPNMNVLSALMAVEANPVTVEGKPTTPVAYDAACLEEVCGSCTMVINGRVRQACSALIDDLEQPIALEPMSKFPTLRDLVVDRGEMFEMLKRIKAWVPIDGTYAIGTGPRETPADQDTRYALSRCMTCGCCLEACPQFLLDNRFTGAQIFSQIRYFNMHRTGAVLKGERLDVMEGPGGITDCGNAQNCVKVCPKEIPLTESIADIGRQTTIHAIKKFFTGK